MLDLHGLSIIHLWLRAGMHPQQHLQNTEESNVTDSEYRQDLQIVSTDRTSDRSIE